MSLFTSVDWFTAHVRKIERIHVTRRKDSTRMVLPMLTRSNRLQLTATDFNRRQYTATYYNTRQNATVNCNTLQRTATLCNTRQRTATHLNGAINTDEEQQTVIHISLQHLTCPHHTRRMTQLLQQLAARDTLHPDNCARRKYFRHIRNRN